MEHKVNLDVFGHAQNLKRMMQDQNKIDVLLIPPLVATFQHLALFFINGANDGYTCP